MRRSYDNIVINAAVTCGHWQSELVNVGVAYCHSEEERCSLDLNPGTYYYQAAAVGKGKGKVSLQLSQVADSSTHSRHK